MIYHLKSGRGRVEAGIVGLHPWKLNVNLKCYFPDSPEVSSSDGLYLIYFHHHRHAQPTLDNIAVAFRKRCYHLPEHWQ